MTETDNNNGPAGEMLERINDPAAIFDVLEKFRQLSPDQQEHVLGEMRKAAGVPLILEVQIGPAPDGWWDYHDDGTKSRPAELCFAKVAPGVNFDDPALAEELQRLREPGRKITLWREM